MSGMLMGKAMELGIFGNGVNTHYIRNIEIRDLSGGLLKFLKVAQLLF
tara:strand:+ start:49 stop:192 length:144 start_codon:yes stop_codon:yes gene_type:complete